MSNSAILNDLAAALVKAQGEFPSVAKDATNPFFKSKYADLATVVKTASPVLAKNGLAISQFISTGETGNTTLITYLIHSTGQFISHAMPLLIAKQDAQGQGSAITYARRYSYMSVLGLVADEDDDGNTATRPKKEISYDKAPDEPSRQVSDEPISPQSMERVKLNLRAKNLTGTKAVEFSDFIIGKPAPTTEADARDLLTALEQR